MFVDSYISTLPVVVHNIRDSEKTSKSKSEGSSPEDVLSEDLKYGTESGNGNGGKGCGASSYGIQKRQISND